MIMQLFRRQSGNEFKTRSRARDDETDAATLGEVARAIEAALAKLQSESDGLTRRLEDAREKASLAVGNDTDEYLTREPEKLASLKGYEDEMRAASARLNVLSDEIANLRFVRATFYSRFTKFGGGA